MQTMETAAINVSQTCRKKLLFKKTFTQLSCNRRAFNACPLEYTDRYNNPIFKELKDNSDCLQTFLTNSVLDMRGKWSQKAFEYLIF